MSVYTSLCHAEIESILSAYQLTPLIHYSGISAGIENTNYLLQTAQGDFVLTLYEHLKASEVMPYLDLLVQLGLHESYYPAPLADTRHEYLQITAAKPAALFKCLPGKSVQQATRHQLQSVATALGRFHLHSAQMAFSNKNPRNIAWIQDVAKQVSPYLSVEDAQLLQAELQYQLQHSIQHLPRGIIHADLFKDNVLFVEEHLTGMLDFYAACHDCYLLDIAITLNDWCVDARGLYDHQRQVDFISAYQQHRVITYVEQKLLPALLRRACLRFWLSRVEHKLNPREGEITQEKDPQFFKNLLLQHRQCYAY
ncbi:homoserine kinase type II [Bathymodiolus japonicus methanotrophic gill symbiont]|uniref:homoserine kinase n=1 Tax=Bathymodiolus japonicus methanotrophic gill symbiont TaxID=113269 RepID=UPI001B54CD18|nr:homoserine kinase [Bathymodiolus japonicus methanotrophic gill symbiont]GFO71740.1 homoserine kinase type II [Bathymodiolus japonicus methanotrophic gill symbiont]